MEKKIVVVPVTGTDLYCHYPGQSDPQRAYIELDVRTLRLSARYNGEIGTAVPMDVYYGYRKRWEIPILTGAAATELMLSIVPLATRIVAGYTKIWNGNNYVARYTDDAHTAIEEIDDIAQDACKNYDNGDLVSYDPDTFALSI